MVAQRNHGRIESSTSDDSNTSDSSSVNSVGSHVGTATMFLVNFAFDRLYIRNCSYDMVWIMNLCNLQNDRKSNEAVTAIAMKQKFKKSQFV